MKTLFDQLNYEFLEKLNEQSVLYPSLTEKIILELKENVSWLHLTVNTKKQKLRNNRII